MQLKRGYGGGCGATVGAGGSIGRETSTVPAWRVLHSESPAKGNLEESLGLPHICGECLVRECLAAPSRASEEWRSCRVGAIFWSSDGRK